MRARRTAGVVMILAAAVWLVPAVTGAQSWMPTVPGYQDQAPKSKDVTPKDVTPTGGTPNPDGYREYGKRSVNININLNANNNQNTNFIRIRR